MCMGVLPACVPVRYVHTASTGKVGSPGTVVAAACEVLALSPLHKHPQ